MSSSVCHAPMPPRMEAFTTRLCLRAVDQYEKILQAHFNKPAKSHRGQSRVKSHRNDASTSPKKERKNDTSSSGTYTASLGAFRQWRKNNEQRTTIVSNATPSSSNQLANSNASKMEQFPLVLSDTTMPDEDLSLKFLALEMFMRRNLDKFFTFLVRKNALDLTAPASDILLKNRLKSWFQLSGHPDGFAPAGPGTVWKRRTGGAENTERIVYEALTKDEQMRDFVPRYYREVEYKGDTFIELQDLLFGFNDPHVMDIKLGTRTFLESEVSKTTERTDLYEKMIAVDPNAPTHLEHAKQAVTKLRYMQFREQQSSTCSHGFRIEAMKLPGGPPITNLKTVKNHNEVSETLRLFLENRRDTCQQLLAKLKELRSRVEASPYFQTHEVIGSSIFMIYDEEKVGVWLIDFAKTYRVPDGQRLTHRRPWEQGNHEEGFLLGLDNLITTIEEIQTSA